MTCAAWNLHSEGSLHGSGGFFFPLFLVTVLWEFVGVREGGCCILVVKGALSTGLRVCRLNMVCIEHLTRLL